MAKKSTKRTIKKEVSAQKNDLPFVIMAPKLSTKTIWDMLNEINAKIGVSIEALQSEIRDKAEEFSKENHSYDECAWLTAEAELHVRNVYALYSDAKLESITVIKPNHDQIRPIAKNIADQQNPIQVLHWMYAERVVLGEKLLKKEKST